MRDVPRYSRGAFIYNGNAGAGKLEQKLSQTIPTLAQNVESLTVLQTQSREDMIEKCKEYGRKVEVLFILGGDGTVHDTVNALADLDSRPVVGVLPGGTCNDYARMLGLPQDLYQASQALVDGDERYVDIGKTKDHYFTNFWGIGLVAETSTNVDSAQKNRFGVLSYFISAMKSMNEANPFKYKITVDGETAFNDQAVVVLVLNGRYIGTRMVPIPDLSLNDGKFDILIVKSSTLTSFRELLTMNSPDNKKYQELYHIQGERVEIETEEQMEIDSDGEINSSTPDSIELIPNHLKMLFHPNAE